MSGLVAFIFVHCFLWNALVLGTTAYLVFWCGFSGWWFALAIILCSSSGERVSKALGRQS